MPGHKKEIRSLSLHMDNQDLFNVASNLEQYSDADLFLLKKCLKLERMRREGKEFSDD